MLSSTIPTSSAEIAVRLAAPASQDQASTSEDKTEAQSIDGFRLLITISILSKIETGTLLGTGCFASVYAATLNGETVAVKTLRLDCLTAENIQTFREESAKMQALQALNLPCIPKYRGYYENPQKDCYQIIMERIEGSNLIAVAQSYAKYVGHIPLKNGAQIMAEVTGACAQFATHRIVHRDLKPENLIWTRHNTIMVVDWGGAIQLDENDTFKPLKTSGSPRYMAGEIAQERTYSLATDMFAVSVMACYFANEGLPFHNVPPEHEVNIPFWVAQSETYPHTLSDNCHATFKKVIESGLQKSPEKRLTMAEAHQAFKTLSESLKKPK